MRHRQVEAASEAWQGLWSGLPQVHTKKNKHAEVRLPESQKLLNVKALKIGEDQTKRS